MSTKLKLVFERPPFGVVTIPKGRMGYDRQTSIRLRRGKTNGVYFRTKNKEVYIQDPNDKKIFYLKER